MNHLFKTTKAQLLLGVATLLLGGCEFIDQIEAHSYPKKCVGGGVQKGEVQELLANNAKQYENRIKHLENIIESMGVNVDTMMIAPQVSQLQNPSLSPQGINTSPLIPQTAQQNAQLYNQQVIQNHPYGPRAINSPNSWQNPNRATMQMPSVPVAPTMVHPLAGPQKQAIPMQHTMPSSPTQQSFYGLPQQFQQPQTQPAYQQVATAPTSGTVLDFRTGIHKGKIRLVFDATGFSNYRPQIQGNVMTIDIPGLSWNTQASNFLSRNPIIASYNTQPLANEAGTRLTLNLKKPAYAGQQGKILPNKDSRNYRMFMDIIAQ